MSVTFIKYKTVCVTRINHIPVMKHIRVKLIWIQHESVDEYINAANQQNLFPFKTRENLLYLLVLFLL